MRSCLWSRRFHKNGQKFRRGSRRASETAAPFHAAFLQLGARLARFDVCESEVAESAFKNAHKASGSCQTSRSQIRRLQVEIVRADVVDWNAEQRSVRLNDDRVLVYDRLCIATGAVPRTLANGSSGGGGESGDASWRSYILQIRDTDTIESLRLRLDNNRIRRLILLGDGGIAMEIAYEARFSPVASSFWLQRSPKFEAIICAF